MNPNTYAAFVDELVKIAEGTGPVSGQGPNEQTQQTANMNSSTYPLLQEGKNSDWRQKGGDGSSKKAFGQKHLKDSPPAREANNLFGLPLSDPPKKGVRKYDQGGPPGAEGPDRSQAPIDAQSSANVAASSRVSPATGPGGV